MAALDRTNYKKIQRSYYNINIYNDTNDVIDCKYSANMIVPLLDKPNQYEVSVVRASVPLDGIPISQANIGFESWQVQFTNTTSNQTSNAYVQQFNPNNATYNDNTAIIGINSQTLQYMTIDSLNSPSGIVPVVITTSPNPSNQQIMNQDDANSNLSNIAYSFNYVCSCSNLILTRYTYAGVYYDETDVRTLMGDNARIIGICASQLRDNVYILVYTPDGDFQGPGTWTINEIFTHEPQVIVLPNSDAGASLPSDNSVASMSCSDTYLSLSCGSFPLGYSSVRNYNISAVPFTVTNPDQPASNLKFTYIDNANRLYVSALDINVTEFYQQDLDTGTFVFKTFNKPAVGGVWGFLGSDTWDNLLVCIRNTDNVTYRIVAYNKTNGGNGVYTIQMGTQQPVSMSQFTYATGTRLEPSLTPNYQIWNYQTYLDQINIAIATAFNDIKGSDGWPSQETPYLSYSDSKFSLNCGVELALPTCIMSFNTRLWNRFIFNSKTNILNPNYEDIQILNLIPNIVPTTTPTLMITQPHNSNFRWFDITRIIVRSTKMSVAGDVELTNTSLLNITDFAVDTSSPDVLLQIYEPTVLRYYQLYQTSPLNAVDVQLSYATRSGDIYPIFLTAGSSGSIKLLFRRSNFQLAL